MTEGPIFKKLVSFTFPLMISGMLQQFYTTADQMVVGKFASDTALAAIGSTSYVTNLILNLFQGMSLGATVTCAKFYGAKNKEGISHTVHTSMALATVCGVFLAILGVFVSRPIMALMDTPSDVIDHSVRYMSIIFAGVPFSLIYNYGSGLLKASGDTKRPLYILTVSGIVNILLNLVFVVFFEMAEAGVALATIMSQAVSAVSVVVLLMKRNDEMKLEFKKICFHRPELVNIIKIGIPTGLNAILFNIANITLQSTINVFGKEYIAGSTAASSINHYISIMQTSLSSATLSFVGQNYGAKKLKRIKKVTHISLLVTFVITIAVVAFITVFPRFFLGLFTTNPEVVERGIGKTIILGLGYILYVPAVIFGASLRATERPKTPMFINIVSICICRLVWILFVFPLFPEGSMFAFNMLFVCYPVSWGLSSISTSVAYFMMLKKVKKTGEYS